MEPIALNASGDLLLKYLEEFNGTGGHAMACMTVRAGWLVVSAGGRWEAFPHVSIAKPILDVKEEEAAWRKYERCTKEFQAPFRWDHPPKSVKAVLERFQFTQETAIAPKAGKGAVVWSPKGLHRDGELLLPRARQWTLRKKTSLAGRGKPIRARFCAGGIALFRNVSHYEEGDKGAEFHFPNFLGSDDIGFDEVSVDALCFIPEAEGPGK